MASPSIHAATPTSFQEVFPYVARIAPTTTGTQAARASACTLGDELRVRDVSEDRVNPSPTSVPTAEAGEYRARRSAAKRPEHCQGQRDQEPQQCRATGEHDLSEPRTCLQSQHGSGQPPPTVLKRHLNRRGFTLLRAQRWGRLLTEP